MLENLPKEKSNIRNDVSLVPLRSSTKANVVNADTICAADKPRLPLPPVDTTLRCRYEMKYFVSESTAQAIRGFIQGFMPLDKYSKKHPDGIYPLISLYFDSHNLQLCRESLDGRKNRFKLRIRSYTDQPDYPCFFEIKRRLNGICLKDRARIDRRYLPTILAGSLAGPLDTLTDNGDAIRQFMLYVRSINAGPVVKVRYWREAYEDDSHNRTRVTFDRRLSFQVTKAADILLNSPGWQLHNETGVVVEVKFTDHYPPWIAEMIKMFNLRRQSFSKYARSVEKSCSLRFCAPQNPQQRIVNR